MLTHATLCKVVTFDAAHDLPNHAGKCRGLHGHTYRVEMEVHGPIRARSGKSDEGMVLDLGDLKAAWQPLDAILDHAYLNDVIPEEHQPTTAENIARFIFDVLSASVPQLSAVRIWETPTGWAEVRA